MNVFAGKWKNLCFFLRVFGETHLVSATQPTLKAYAEKGATGIYSSRNQSPQQGSDL
jgi:2,3-bisphosphoglycerate-independent phosphoglycerate mutase